jgi:hypothetical protein
MRTRSRLLAAAVSLCDYVNRVGWADLIAGLEVVRRAVERELVERDDLCPSRFYGEASAHYRINSFTSAVSTNSINSIILPSATRNRSRISVVTVKFLGIKRSLTRECTAA